MLQKFIENWQSRHRMPFNLVLHAIGIPLTIIAIIPLLCGKFAAAALLFIGGYVLQFIGHAREKSEVGEFMWIKKLLKK